jgi:predicted regulator of Ras-like GTPase activity (Roadblock/LC7/MglB family)
LPAAGQSGGAARRRWEGLVERRSSAGCDGRSEARTQGAFVSVDTAATEDAASGRSSAARRHSAAFRQALRDVSVASVDAQQALGDLMDVSSQIESAVVYDTTGKVVVSTLSGAEAAERFAKAAEGLLAAAEEAKGGSEAVTHLEAATGDGSVFIVRKGERKIAATTAAEPTVALVFYDLRTCLENVAEEPKPKPRKRAAPRKQKPATKDDGAT